MRPTDASPPAHRRSASLAVICVIALAFEACGTNTPTASLAPSPQPTTPAPPAAPGQSTRIFGVVVDDRHAPVSSAKLTFDGIHGSVTTTADGSGAFDVHVVPYFSGFHVVLEKPGYER